MNKSFQNNNKNVTSKKLKRIKTYKKLNKSLNNKNRYKWPYTVSFQALENLLISFIWRTREVN